MSKVDAAERVRREVDVERIGDRACVLKLQGRPLMDMRDATIGRDTGERQRAVPGSSVAAAVPLITPENSLEAFMTESPLPPSSTVPAPARLRMGL